MQCHVPDTYEGQTEVWAQRRRRDTPELVGWVEPEDLGDVLTHLVSRRAPNGPEGPMTQYLLAQAAHLLARRLREDADTVTDPNEERAPRVLSALVGHETFVAEHLGLSVNQMRRRWPLAADWYDDLLAYVLRPQRHRFNHDAFVDQFATWLTLPMGDIIGRLIESQVMIAQDDLVYGLAETLQWMWPRSGRVRQALIHERETIRAFYRPVALRMLAVYDIRLRPGTDVDELLWAINALVSWEAHQRSIDPTMCWFAREDPGRAGSRTTRLVLQLLTVMVTDQAGCDLDAAELERRTPGVHVTPGR